MFYRLLLLCCFLSGPVLAKQGFFGTVTFVTDGDTLWVAPAQGGAVRKLRIDGLDAPEICQAGGETARAVLMDAALHKRVWVEVRRLDIYGRGLAKVWLDRNDLGFSNYDCKRETQCPEGTFCQSDQCIPIVTPAMTNSAGATGYYA